MDLLTISTIALGNLKNAEHVHEIWPRAKICGHRDFSPDKNGNGVIDPWEYIKACPCFDARHEYAYIFGEE